MIINNLQGVTHIIIKLAVNYYQQKMAMFLTVYDNYFAFIKINDYTLWWQASCLCGRIVMKAYENEY